LNVGRMFLVGMGTMVGEIAGITVPIDIDVAICHVKHAFFDGSMLMMRWSAAHLPSWNCVRLASSMSNQTKEFYNHAHGGE
jgi:hypothetical protein